MNWKYKLKSGIALRDAICSEDLEQVVNCLLACCVELNRKLRGEDKSNYTLDIEDIYEGLAAFEINESEEENEEAINDYLEQFYDICDSVGAWIEM